MVLPDREAVERRIRKEFGEGRRFDFEGDVNYSEIYLQFKRETLSPFRKVYEKLALGAGKILNLRMKKRDEEILEQYLALAHLDISPKDVFALAYLTFIFMALASMVLFLFVFPNLYLFVVMFLLSLLALASLQKYPRKIVEDWKIRSQDQLALAVLYINIYMRQNSNLERGIYFASKIMGAPLSLDFLRMLWSVQAGIYENVSEALNFFLQLWEEQSPEFVEAMHLVVSTLYEKSQTRRLNILDRAMTVILDGTQQNMQHYARELQNPVRNVHTFGIILPTLLLTLLPVAAIVSPVLGDWRILAGIFVLFLPLFLYIQTKQIIARRPASISYTDLTKSKRFVPSIRVLGFEIPINPLAVSILFTTILLVPGINYMARFIRAFPQEEKGLLFSSFIVISLSLGYSLYNFLSVYKLISLNRIVRKIEKELSPMIFQLGSGLLEGLPAEKVFVRMQEQVKGSYSQRFVRKVNENMGLRGMTLEEALFDERAGAVSLFPGPLIKTSMQILIMGAKKSAETTGQSLMSFSLHYRSLIQVNERINDLLADVVAEMTIEVKFIIPVLLSAIVSLNAIITKILSTLGKNLQLIGELNAVDAASGELEGAQVSGISTSLLNFFNVKSLLAPSVVHIIIGIFVLELTIILTTLIAGVIFGADEVQLKSMLSKNVINAAVLYIAVSVILTYMLSGMTKGIGELGI